MPNLSRRDFMAAGIAAAAASRRTWAAPTGDLPALSLKQASDLIRSKKASPVELTEACLASIKTFNPKTDAWITVMKEQALAQAKMLEKEQSSGRFRSPLHGIPIGLKDNIDAASVRTTAASKTLEANVPTEDAEVTRRLRAAGAVLIGKCNMHIFAQGATSAVSYFGPVRNPWNLEMIAGGSSGGSAAGVATDNCYAALGTDTGGSVRTPSAMCGVVGFKATYGRVSIRGIVPLTWSLDHCGPIARTVEDAALVLQHIAGYDRLDLQCIDYPVPDYSKAIGAPVSAFRLGIPPMFFDGLDDEIAQAMDEAIAVLAKLTQGSREIAMPNLLGTGAGSEGAVYREALGNGFVDRIGTAPPAAGGAEWRSPRGRLHSRMAPVAAPPPYRQRGGLRKAERGPDDHAHHPPSALDHRGRARPPRQRPAPSSRARKHPVARRLRPAHHHRALWVFKVRPAHRPANQWSEPGRNERALAGPRV